MHQDNWAIKAKNQGYRSRAVYKLEELLDKTKFLKNSEIILDVGSSPGGWSQFLSINYPKKNIYAIDILEMKFIPGVDFYNVGIENIDSIKAIRKLKGHFNLVISDLAPNITGIRDVDEENTYNLNNLTIQLGHNYLNTHNGKIIIKTFQNTKLKTLRKDMSEYFKNINTFKPAASKTKSQEIYLCGEKK